MWHKPALYRKRLGFWRAPIVMPSMTPIRRAPLRGWLIVTAIVAWVMAGATVAVPAASADEVLLPDCSNLAFGGRAVPVAWSTGCLGGSINLDRLAWQGWGGPEAIATGIDRYNDCEPSCAEGTIYEFPAELRVFAPKRCASRLGAKLYYTRYSIVIEFPDGNEVGQPPGRSEPFYHSVDCPKPGFLVRTRASGASFGPFIEEGEYDGARLENLFGKPHRHRRDGRLICAKSWPSMGLTVWLGSIELDSNPCDEGRFLRAILKDSRWHTPTGVSSGDSARVAAAASVRGCTVRLCRTHGYVLSQHRSDCSIGRYPSVIAETRGGRVRRLLILSHFCE
jgi:hypothetical protein